ncbi:MAG: serine/threonine-protein kinase [Gammaproteobacteria bacterium]
MSDPTVSEAYAPSLPRIPGITLERAIGRGGSGVVYDGRQNYLGRRIAVKILLPSDAASAPSFVQRFRQEAKTLASLSHPNVVTCHQAGVTQEGACYLAMDFIDGSDLKDWIRTKGPLCERHALAVVRKIASALAYALECGFIHRDIKPDNILLQRIAGADDEFPYEPKLADLGLVRRADPDATHITITTLFMGTPVYMAPEQFSDPLKVDFRADVYGLGCVLHEMLTGTAPFTGADVPSLVAQKARGPSAPLAKEQTPGVAELINRLLAPSPHRRPQSYAEVIDHCHALERRVLRAESRPSFPAKRIWVTAAMVTAIAAAALYQAHFTPQPLDDAHEKEHLVEHRDAAVSVPSAPNFSETGEALSTDDVAEPLPGWEPPLGSGLWVGAEEGGGINAIGTGARRRTLGSLPCRIEGSVALLTDTSRDAGLRIELADGTAVALSMNKLKRHFVTWTELGKEEKRRGRRSSRMIDFLPLDSNAPAHVPFRLDLTRGRLSGRVGARSLTPITVAGAPVAVSLFVNEATVSFRDLQLYQGR